MSYHQDVLHLPPLCYIEVHAGKIHKTIEFQDILLDLDKNGTVLGIELLKGTTVIYDREEESE